MCHPPFAPAAKVNGNKKSERPAARSINPIRSKALAKFVNLAINDTSGAAVCLVVSTVRLALCSAQASVITSGATVAGTRIANLDYGMKKGVSPEGERREMTNLRRETYMPSTKSNIEYLTRVKNKRKNLHPHLHPAPFKTPAATCAPINPLIMNGADIRADTSPRHFSVVMSAMMIWVRI